MNNRKLSSVNWLGNWYQSVCNYCQCRYLYIDVESIYLFSAFWTATKTVFCTKNCTCIWAILTHLLLIHGAEFQLVKKFPAFYGTRRFIPAVTSARHLSLSWAISVQSIHPHPIARRSILILSSHLSLGLPSGLFPSGFPIKTLDAPLLSPILAMRVLI
jgi:hypothetical protein